MARIVRANVVQGSSSNDLHKVTLTSPGLWEESELCPVANNIPLNEGDLVYVDISDGIQSPMVLGRARDNNFETHSTLEKGNIIYEIVDADGNWTVLAAVGNKTLLEIGKGDSSTTSIAVDNESVKVTTSKLIELGTDGSEKAVLGETLKAELEKILQGIEALTVPTAFGPSGTPINGPTTFAQIRGQLDQILSKLNKLQ